MSKLSFLDKLKILIELSQKSKLYIGLIVLLIVFAVVMITTNSKNKNRNKIIYAIVSALIFVYILFTYNVSIGKLFTYMMNNFFIALYFPNIAIYFAAIIITSVIVLTSLFSYKTTKRIKVLNVIVYTIINYMLILLLGIINKSKLDVFTLSSIYENKKATALIELTSIIFITWILFLMVYRMILSYLKKDYKPKVKKIIIRKKIKKLPENFIPIDIPRRVYGNFKKAVYNNRIVELITSPLSTADIRNSEIAKEFDNLFTINDYKVLSKLLQEQKEKELKEKIELRDKLINDKKEAEYNEEISDCRIDEFIDKNEAIVFDELLAEKTEKEENTELLEKETEILEDVVPLETDNQTFEAIDKEPDTETTEVLEEISTEIETDIVEVQEEVVPLENKEISFEEIETERIKEEKTEPVTEVFEIVPVRMEDIILVEPKTEPDTEIETEAFIEIKTEAIAESSKSFKKGLKEAIKGIRRRKQTKQEVLEEVKEVKTEPIEENITKPLEDIIPYTQFAPVEDTEPEDEDFVLIDLVPEDKVFEETSTEITSVEEVNNKQIVIDNDNIDEEENIYQNLLDLYRIG